MQNQSKRKQQWTQKQIQILKQYVIQQRSHLRSKFYQNIAAGTMRFRKTKGFFIQMGVRVGKSSEKCKSKFQKMESEIYLEHLDIPERHFELYKYLRAGAKLTSNRICESALKKTCVCSSEDTQSHGNGRVSLSLHKAEDRRACQGADMHLSFENLRIEIILKCKTGEFGPINLGISKLGTESQIE